MATRLDTFGLRPKLPVVDPDSPLLLTGQVTKMPLPTFFDDFIVPVVAENPVTLLKHLSKALALTAESLAKSGMQINDKPGKTEVLVDFHGTGKQYAASLMQCAHVTSIQASGPTFKALSWVLTTRGANNTLMKQP